MFSILRGGATPHQYALLALGDSILSDCYPGVGAGAASLLYANLDQKFPDFRGRDLKTRSSGLPFLNLTRSGFTLADVTSSLSAVPLGATARVVLVSVGGNDVLHGLLSDDASWVEWLRKYREFLAGLRSRFGGGLVVCNLYDPTDGTGVLQSALASGTSVQTAPLVRARLDALQRMNQLLAEVSSQTGSRLADIYRHFMGHGSQRLDQRGHPLSGYWYQRDIEPSSTGASETRRVIFEAIETPQ